MIWRKPTHLLVSSSLAVWCLAGATVGDTRLGDTNMKYSKEAFSTWSSPPIASLKFEPVDSPSVMDITVEAGNDWPDIDKVRAAAIDPDKLEDLSHETSKWLAKILRPSFHPQDDDVSGYLVGVRGLVGGQDAFLASWIAQNRPLRILVTRERIHIVTPLELGSGPEAALELGNELFAFDNPAQLSEFEQFAFRGTTVLLSPEAVIPNWNDDLMAVVAKGVVKFSILKTDPQTEPLERTSLHKDPFLADWFEGR